MKHIPSEIIENVLTFLDSESLKQTRVSNKSILDVTSIENDIWEQKLKSCSKYMIKKIRICNSNILTYLTIKNSDTCFNCTNPMHKIHPIYNIILCNHCFQDDFFKVVPFIKTCKKYFIDPSIASEIPYFFSGSNRRVLEKDIIKLAEGIHTPDVLYMKMGNREISKKRKFDNRNESLNTRIEDLRHYYDMENTRFPIRIDTPLKDMEYSISLVEKNLCQFIFGDIFYFKINTICSSKEIGKILIDFSWMLTYLRKKGIVDDEYNIIDEYSTLVHIRFIMRCHIRNEHFYEIISDMVESKVNLDRRISRMDNYIEKNKDILDETNRNKLSQICCVEEDIDLDEEIFDEFITSGIGNPVRLARDKRIAIFLNKNGYMSRYADLFHIGFSHEKCDEEAFKFAISNSGGMEIMNSCCIIDLPVVQ